MSSITARDMVRGCSRMFAARARWLHYNRSMANLQDLAAWALVERDGRLYVRVTAPHARIVHEEHGPITLTTGLYRVVRQREYTPTAIRNVAD